MKPVDGPIGVLALQGDFARHASLIASLGLKSTEVRTAGELDACSGLVMPGGESTTIRMGIDREGLAGPLRAFLEAGRPILGTCAGMVLMGREHLGLIDISVQRNAYGRQVHSFETDVEIEGVEGLPMRALFIRAPIVRDHGSAVEILGEFDGTPIAVREGNAFAISFHPELIGDARMHELALRSCLGATNLA